MYMYLGRYHGWVDGYSGAGAPSVFLCNNSKRTKQARGITNIDKKKKKKKKTLQTPNSIPANGFSHDLRFAVGTV